MEISPYSVQNPVNAGREKGGIDDFLSRREFVASALGIIGTVFAQGVTASMLMSRDNESSSNKQIKNISKTKDACAENIPCDINRGLVSGQQFPNTNTNQPAIEFTNNSPAPTTTSTTPPRSIINQKPTDIVEGLNSAPTIRRGYQIMEQYGEQLIDKVPSLVDLNASFGSTVFFNDVNKQLEHIEYLDKNISLSADEYNEFTPDMSRSHSFRDKGMIAVKSVVWHWTGDHYDNVDHIVNGLKSKGCGVQYYVHSDSQTYQLTPTSSHYQDHALGVSDFTAGIEIYTGDYDGVNSPLFNYTPETVKAGLYTAEKILREVGLKASKQTLISHFSADLIFVNPYYDPIEGVFNHIQGFTGPRIRKFDVIQEMTDMLIRKLTTLEEDIDSVIS